MKVNNYRLIVLMFLSLSVCLWYSCKKSETVNEKPEIAIGVWHNDALALYAENKTLANSQILGHDKVREQVIRELIKKDKITFNEVELRASLKKMDALPISAEIKAGVSSGKTVEQLPIIVKYLKNSNEISAELALALENIYNLTLKGANGSVIFKAVNDLKTSKFESGDQKYIDAFVNVFNASDKFWKGDTKAKRILYNRKEPVKTMVADPGNGGGGPIEGGVTCTQSVILADAAGALYGLILSPAFSIIEGAAFSLIASINPPCEEPAPN